MRRALVLCSSLVVSAGVAGVGFAQQFKPEPPQGEPFSGSAPSQTPLPMPGGSGGQPTSLQPSSPPNGPGPLGFGPNSQPPAQGQPSQPLRQNYADELTDFGVPPQNEMQQNVASPTPTSIPGGHVITTAEIHQAVGKLLMFDVLQGNHPSIPSAMSMPGVGMAGTYDDAAQRSMWAMLSQATHMNPNTPIVFFCAGSRCWESYNAALRALHLGFKTVLWYRGGLASWQAAGGQLVQADQRGDPSQQTQMGFGRQ